jgi:hypothetical protein
MNGSQTSTPGSEGLFRKHFFGASPVLRVMAWLAVICLLLGWLPLFLLSLGIPHDYFPAVILTSHLTAFVIGISSCSPLGGIASLLAAATLSVCVFFIAGGLAIP